jgi:hypothetical protein
MLVAVAHNSIRVIVLHHCHLPYRTDFVFERFLNVNRKSPPDFDIDWSWKERDTILQYILTNMVPIMSLLRNQRGV